MTPVSNQTELLNAVASKETHIQAVSDFTVSKQITVRCSLTLTGCSDECPVSLYKDASFPSSMFHVLEGGSLTLQNIVLDGQKELHSGRDPMNRSLILISGGTLILKHGTVLRNNHSYTEGGGVYFSGIASLPNNFLMTEDSQISGCSSRLCGGAVMAAVKHPDDKLSILGRALITHNTAAHGAGIYLRSFEKRAGSILTVSDSSAITDNIALGCGGGINFSGFREDAEIPSSLTVSGNVRISGNASAYGGGIYFFGCSEEDQLDIEKDSVLSENSAKENGGGLCLVSQTGASVTVNECSISKNKADGQGGGISLTNRSSKKSVRLALMNSDIKGNRAASCGGGIVFSAGSGEFSFHLTDSRIFENISSSDGGGIAMSSSGSGIVNVSQTSFSRNTAKKSGGGLAFLSESSSKAKNLSLTSAEFIKNQAGSGGGIFLDSKEGAADANLYDCIIEDNTARFGCGGGILSHGFGNIVSLRGTTRLSQNLAKKAGVGISLECGSSLILEEGPNLYDGFFLKDADTHLYLQNTLHPNACIRLENSEYISPNKEGNPIVICAPLSEYFGLQPSDAEKFRMPSHGFNGWEFRLNPDRTFVLLAPVRFRIRYENLLESSNTNPVFYTTDSPDLILNPPEELPGLAFLGWYDDPFGGKQINMIPHGSTEHYTLYARWKPEPVGLKSLPLFRKRFPLSLLSKRKQSSRGD